MTRIIAAVVFVLVAGQAMAYSTDSDALVFFGKSVTSGSPSSGNTLAPFVPGGAALSASP